MTATKLYGDLAQWWPIFSAKEDYADEAACFREIVLTAVTPPPKTLVEFGSGGGNNAFHLKRDFAMTLVDASPAMIEVSRARIPSASTWSATCAPSGSTASSMPSLSTMRSCT
jgi:ubiquinone/menaquinone biosynthesis C-methylase UbiE